MRESDAAYDHLYDWRFLLPDPTPEILVTASLERNLVTYMSEAGVEVLHPKDVRATVRRFATFFGQESAGSSLKRIDAVRGLAQDAQVSHVQLGPLSQVPPLFRRRTETLPNLRTYRYLPERRRPWAIVETQDPSVVSAESARHKAMRRDTAGARGPLVSVARRELRRTLDFVTHPAGAMARNGSLSITYGSSKTESYLSSAFRDLDPSVRGGKLWCTESQPFANWVATDDSGNDVLMTRLARHSDYVPRLKSEATALRVLGPCAGRTFSIPSLLDDSAVDVNGVVQSFVPGVSARSSSLSRDSLLNMAVRAVASLPGASGDMGDGLRDQSAPFHEILAEPKMARFHDAARASLSLIRCMDWSCVPRVAEHGDFHYGNILVKPGGSIGIIDWETFKERGFPLQDLVHLIQFDILWPLRGQGKNVPNGEEAGELLVKALSSSGGWARVILENELRNRECSLSALKPLVVLQLGSRVARSLRYEQSSPTRYARFMGPGHGGTLDGQIAQWTAVLACLK